MDNEIRTFVYRAGQVRREAAKKAKELKKKLIYTVAALTVLITCITAVSVIASDRKDESADLSAVTENDQTLAGADGIEPETAVADQEPSQTVNGTFTNISKHAAQHKEIPFYTAIEEDDGLMLLDIDDGSAKEYIPADLGAEKSAEDVVQAAPVEESTDVEEASNGDFSSKLEEVADKIDDATAPEDVPEGLTFRYNKKMILDLDEENLNALYRIVEAEATDQDVYGRMLVANVVINRTYGGFSKTVKGVIFQKIGGSQQFAPIRDGRYYTVDVTAKTKEAVDRVLKGEDYSNGALYFFQRDLTTSQKAAWFDNELKYLFKYGCHEFYTEKDPKRQVN
ncbi:MAG: cell wall hydrolase [Lachnospiraceae bacterium]|nr:cell wall hydrolase [Lachnospiraceae bacterium]